MHRDTAANYKGIPAPHALPAPKRNARQTKISMLALVRHGGTSSGYSTDWIASSTQMDPKAQQFLEQAEYNNVHGEHCISAQNKIAANDLWRVTQAAIHWPWHKHILSMKPYCDRQL